MHANPKRRNADYIRKSFKRSGGHGYTLTTLDWSLRISREPKHGRAFAPESKSISRTQLRR
jgi:predicted urease superfamily metal-dependent hydrolase